MNQFRNKAYIVFFSLFFLIFINTCYGLFSIYQTYKENHNLQMVSTEIAKTTYKLEYMTSKLNFLGQQHVIEKDTSQMEKYNTEIAVIYRELNTLINDIADAANLNSANILDYKSFKDKWETYWSVYSQAIEYSMVNKDERSLEWLVQANNEYEELSTIYLRPLTNEFSEMYSNLLQTSIRNIVKLIWGGAIQLLTALLGFILTYHFLKRIFKEASRLSYRLEFLAFHDELTRLANRRLFQQKVTETLNESPGKFALMYLDMDKFKYINDHFGHDVGDSVIKAFAIRVKSCIRDADTFARQGGDEFTILLKEVNDKEIIEIAKRIIDSFAKPIKVGKEPFNISVSIGIAIYPDDDMDYLTLLKNADEALYEAKKERNTFKFSDWALN